MNFRFQTSDSAPRLYPPFPFYEDYKDADGRSNLIMRRNNQHSDWGEATATVVISSKELSLPRALELGWLSVVESKCYKFSGTIDSEKIAGLFEKRDDNDNPLFEYLVVGMAPYGGVAIWLRGPIKSVIIDWKKAKLANPNERGFKDYLTGTTVELFSQNVLAADELMLQNLLNNGLPALDTFDNWMRQYEYRFTPLEEYWDGNGWQEYDEDDLYYDDMDLTTLEVQRFDGTHDQLNDLRLLRYHEAGMPKRLKVKWRVGRDDFSAFYWFNDAALHSVFSRYAAMDAEGRMELLLRIDTRHERYAIAVKSDMMPQPTDIPAEGYEMLVFNNGNELWRSDNFAQENGAWDW